MASSSETDKQLSVALLNINGLRDKTPYIRYIIDKHQLHVVALCETKLDPTVKDSRVYIEGFRMWRKDRNSNGGGVALYVQEQIETRLRLDLMKTGAEIIWVEMKFPDSKSVLLGCCYRPPVANAEYLNLIKNKMDQVSKEKEEKDILLMGDFNLNWEKTEDQKKVNFMSDLGFKQIVNDYTRVIPEQNTKTIIDHIYTNIEELTSQTKTEQEMTESKVSSQKANPESIATHFSDHNYLTFTISRNVPKWIRYYRLEKEVGLYQKKICVAHWGDVSEKSDLKEAVSEFTEKLIQKLNDCAPSFPAKKDIYGSLKLPKENKEIYVDNDEVKQRYIQNYLDTGIFDPKKNMRNDEGEAAPQTLKNREKQGEKTKINQTVFEVFKDYLGESYPCLVISITPEGEVTTEADYVVNLHQPNTETTNRGRQPEFIFSEIEVDIVKTWLGDVCDHVINKIDPTEAKLIKELADQISGPICHIVNKFISSKTCPDELKKIKTFRFSPDSYISSIQISDVERVHLLLSYILDGILYEQVKQIPTASLGERPTQNVWLIASKNNQKVGAVFLDLNSSLSTFSHYLLRKTLRNSGFTDPACDLIKSFISSRGLPSGSFLGQLLYKIFINNLKVLQPSAVVHEDRVEFLCPGLDRSE